MFTKLKANVSRITREYFCDDSQRLSLAKTMLGLGFLFVSFFFWELVITRQLTAEFLIIYICFVSGQHMGSKALDKFKDGTDDSK
jgi:hypothetical protein